MAPQELYHVIDPLGGAGTPGNPMEHVLSLQSLSDGDSGAPPGFTNTCSTNLCENCDTNVCNTNICWNCNTNGCFTSNCS